jgi:putative SOS response-associated peptidase YedK
MCTRFVLLKEQLRATFVALGLEVPPVFGARYNIAPGTTIPALRRNPSRPGAEAALVQWSLVPAWAKTPPSTALVNARAETVTVKPSFRDAFLRRRCVIPASGFYEWAQHGKARKPWLFQRPGGAAFGFAGLWETWRAPNGTVLESCAFITTAPNAVMRPVHHRMPVILTPATYDSWLDPAADPEKHLIPLLRPAPDDTLTATALSSYVSNVRHEGPACLTPAGPDDGDPAPQLSLGFD